MASDHDPLKPALLKQGEPIAIVCGNGSLPVELADGAIQSGRHPFLVGIEGEAETEIEQFSHRYLKWGQMGALFKLLKERNILQIVFAGGVKSRPELLRMKLDWGTVRSLPRLLGAMLGGDNTLLTGLIGIFQQQGIEVVGAHQVAPFLLAGDGPIAGRKPGRKLLENVALAAKACHELGKLDIGQAAVAEAHRVVAVEGVEGTDALIGRIVELRKSGRMPQIGKYGVLVKMMKPGQDMRVDMPAIGPDTVLGAARAGLIGIGVEPAKTLILQRDRTLELAKENRIFIYGYSAGQQIDNRPGQ